MLMAGPEVFSRGCRWRRRVLRDPPSFLPDDYFEIIWRYERKIVHREHNCNLTMNIMR